MQQYSKEGGEQNSAFYPPPPPPQPHQNYPTAPTYNYNNYATPPPQPDQQPYYHGEETEKAVRPSSGWKDIWALILWLLNLGAFIGVSVLALRTYNSNSSTFGSVNSSTQYSGAVFGTGAFQIFGLAAVVGFGISFLYLLLANAFPRFMIIATFIGSIIVYFGVTIYYFTQHYYSAAIVFLIFSCLYLLAFWWWRSRIPFATVMLETVCSICRRHPSSIVAGLISLIIQTAFSIWFSLVVVGAYQTWFSTTSNNARINLAMVFIVFSYYWTSQVISYVTHVTLSGLYATVYFLNDQVRHPILGSFKRAVTTSFGSICFGSLLIAIVNMIRYFLQILQNNTDNPILSFLVCIVQCIVGCFQGIFEWFTHYAFSGVAIFGEAFIPSARRTWNLMKDRGIDAMVNDSLIGNVLFMGKVIDRFPARHSECYFSTKLPKMSHNIIVGGLLVGVLSSLLGFIYLKAAQPAYNQTGGMTPIVVMVCFLIGSSMFSSIATVISSGVATTFVCLAEDPDALRRTRPELFEKIRETYPRVVQGV
ncbi:plasma-membrane choline transporter-domain-containing protein [Phascolomyces articulosus]|uniref:Protein PNS1 n=1 Tax=Phascolomyces articulosus TaxID=60185 RepID=A0AAD5JVP1_9FUNG|nr:plasma-membrane choline transporter-domain-containing protein [Phascolomyces articulosus]